MIEKFFKIKGFLEHEEGIALYEACKNSYKNGNCVEVGSYCGKSACYIGLACKEVGSKLFRLIIIKVQKSNNLEKSILTKRFTIFLRNK